jgi:hypothetical protein
MVKRISPESSDPEYGIRHGEMVSKVTGGGSARAEDFRPKPSDDGGRGKMKPLLKK